MSAEIASAVREMRAQSLGFEMATTAKVIAAIPEAQRDFKPEPMARCAYEIAWHITEARLGQSLCTGIGGDPVTGLDFVMVLEMFRNDASTRGVVLVGEVGGKAEELAAEYIVETKYPKPVVAYIAGRSAPPEKRMGHAGAIVVGNVGTAKSKVEAFMAAGVTVADKPSDIPRLLRARL